MRNPSSEVLQSPFEAEASETGTLKDGVTPSPDLSGQFRLRERWQGLLFLKIYSLLQASRTRKTGHVSTCQPAVFTINMV